MRAAHWLRGQLPAGMVDDEFFCRFLEIFEGVADTVLDQIDTLGDAFDPTIAPPTMVREMSRWLGNDWLGEHHEEVDQRRTVLTYPRIIRRRGTRSGVTEMLELVTGPGTVQVDDSGGVYPVDEASHARPHVMIRITSTTWSRQSPLVGWASTDDLIRIVTDEIPASVDLTLKINDETVWPRPLSVASKSTGAG